MAAMMHLARELKTLARDYSLAVLVSFLFIFKLLYIYILVKYAKLLLTVGKSPYCASNVLLFKK